MNSKNLHLRHFFYLSCLFVTTACSDDIIASDSSDLPNEPLLKQCGNHVIDSGEICDGDLFAQTPECPPGWVLPKGKSLTCNADCTLNTENCVSTCGNGKLDDGEICDGESFAESASCPEGTQRMKDRKFECLPNCTLDLSVCATPLCGNAKLDEGEICDGTLFSSQAKCPDNHELQDGKSLSCNENCTLNIENCERISLCGNAKLDEGEICDGTLFSSQAKCPDGTQGKLSCNADCTLNTDSCASICGNGILDEGEICDGTLFSSQAKCPDGTRGKLSCNADCTLNTSQCQDYCVTTIEYSDDWMHSADRTDHIDVVENYVTWDGNCTTDSSGNSYAKLSNGWEPYFSGKSSLMAFNYEGKCPVENTCRTRIFYGSNWLAAPGNTQFYDDVGGVVTWNGVCSTDHATLSNGWTPYFNGTCQIAIRYSQCGGFFTNPVIPSDAPDPGVMFHDNRYYQVNTGGDTNHAYPLRISSDLKTWNWSGYAFTPGNGPTWALNNFWAPELHKVGGKFHIYYSARQRENQQYAIGVGVSDTPEGPYKDIGHPLVTKNGMGLIDASYFKDSDGKHYVLWKEDGNAVGVRTPIYIQELDANGTSVVGTPTEILSNTLSWEGALVEGPWLIKRGKYYYLFYSGNGYADARYALGVARATAIRGPYTKYGNPIIKAQGYFQGPGHGSVLQTPSGEWIHVYHSWINGKVDKYPPGRVMLVDRITWIDDWPMSYSAPLRRSQPIIR